MGHIFISYSHKDKTYAHKLQRNLLEQGFEAWIDDRIDYGTQWPAEIEKRLRDCDAFILIMSPPAYESEWVQNELNLARKLKKPIFPLLLDGEEWWHVGTTQFVNVIGGKLPNTKFYVRLAEVSPRKWTGGRGSVDPRPTQDEVKRGSPDPRSPENLDPRPPAGVARPPVKAWYQRTEIIIAIIGLVGTLCAALIGALPWKDWLAPNPAPTPILVSSLATTEAFTPIVTPLSTEITDPKGVVMRLIPEGDFTMGSDNGADDEKPVHTVTLTDYYMDVHEVTNARYKACVLGGKCQTPSDSSSQTHPNYYGNSQYDNYPVIYVDWNQAKAYCEWRGARLPTEAEWEKAAHGKNGGTYPWGEGIDNTFANYNAEDTTKVGMYEKGKSDYGIYDMAGNVWEWVDDWYDAYPGNMVSNSDYGTKYRVLRGGSWYDDDSNVLSANRDWPGSTNRGVNFGFRCARSP